LKLTTAGLRARDERVFDLARRLHVPIAVTMAGGYGRNIETTVEVHLNTVRAAFAHFRARTPRQLASVR
jgi:acetoin utilization deacetylase AcuC-like enzyme